MLAACKEVDDTVVLSIAKHCPKLKKLSLRGCRVTDTSVCEVAIHCHNLLLLALAGLHKLTDKCVIALAGNCPYLDELYISGCSMITSAATRYLQVSEIERIQWNFFKKLTIFIAKYSPTFCGVLVRKDIMKRFQYMLCSYAFLSCRIVVLEKYLSTMSPLMYHQML